MHKLFVWTSVGGKPEKSTHVRNRCTMPHLLTEWERLELEIVALKKKIAEKEKWLKEYNEETRKIEMETMKKNAKAAEKEKLIKEYEEEARKIEMENMNKYGVKPVTGQKRQRDEVQEVESSSSEEKKCTGCSSCQGPLASDGEDADDEYENAGGGNAAGSSKNS